MRTEEEVAPSSAGRRYARKRNNNNLRVAVFTDSDSGSCKKLLQVVDVVLEEQHISQHFACVQKVVDIPGSRGNHDHEMSLRVRSMIQTRK